VQSARMDHETTTPPAVPPYMARWRGGAKGVRGGASPYGPKANLKNWTLEERRVLIAGIERIADRICGEEGINSVQIFGHCRSKVRDACRVRVIREVCHELQVAPAVVARVFACHRQTVMQALRGKKRKNDKDQPTNPAE